ncbi:MAG: hypothetical protein OXU98_08205, partial [Gammaproteobacteria bacterium]|nr:hypothetical protein [Gammaproteobacteria bacterium]
MGKQASRRIPSVAGSGAGLRLPSSDWMQGDAMGNGDAGKQFMVICNESSARRRQNHAAWRAGFILLFLFRFNPTQEHSNAYPNSNG